MRKSIALWETRFRGTGWAFVLCGKAGKPLAIVQGPEGGGPPSWRAYSGKDGKELWEFKMPEATPPAAPEKGK